MATTVIRELFNTVTSTISGITSKLLVAAIIILIGFIIGKITGKVIKKGLHEIELNNIIRKITKVNIAVEDFISGFVTFFIYFLAIVMALKHLGLATDILNIISGAVILIITISILLGVKDIIPNAFSGFIIHYKKFLSVGDTIIVKGMEGKIIEIGLVEINIKAKNGDIIRIPSSIITNSEIVKKKIQSRKGKR